jgi:hypothetical protein
MRIATLEELCSKSDANVVHLGQLQQEDSYIATQPISLTGYLNEADEKHLVPLISEEFVARSPALDLYSVSDAIVSPNAAVSSGDYIIADSLRPYLHLNDVLAQFGRRISPAPDGKELDIKLSGVRRIRKPVLLLRDHGEAGYFHFLHSVLPRLLLWKQFPSADLHIAVSNSFQTQFLDYLGIPKERFHFAVGQTYLCDHLYMISGLVRPDWTSGGFFERPLEVTRQLRHLIPHDASYFGKRIYISRRDSNIRAIQNEDVFERILTQRFGFEACVLSEMNPEQQIRTFASAAIVVGSHGAGLSNASFMEPGSILFEIFPRSRIWPTFRAIASRAGLRYAAHVSATSDHFDIDELVSAIQNVLATAP